MKPLYFYPSDFARPSGTWCHRAHRLEDGHEGADIDLSDPTSISLADIRHLRDQAQTLENEDIVQLNHLMEYHISLADNEASGNDFPSRIVWEVFHSPLVHRLDPKLRLKIIRILRVKKDELAQFAESINKGRKKIDDLNDEELIKMNRAFSHLRAYSDEDTRKIRETLQEKMLQMGAEFLSGYIVEKDTDTDEDIISPLPQTQEMSAHKRLWILELYRNFKQKHFWPAKGDPQKIKLLAQKAVQTINENIFENNEGDSKNLKSMVLFWDLLEELDQLDADFSDLFSTSARERIATFVRQGNQAQFLDWCARYFDGNDKVLLEDHVKTLVRIREEEDYQTQPDPDFDAEIDQKYEAKKKNPDEDGIGENEKTKRTRDNAELDKKRDEEKTQRAEERTLQSIFENSEANDEASWIIKPAERAEYEDLKESIDQLNDGTPIGNSDNKKTPGIFALKQKKDKEGLTNSQEEDLKKMQKELEEAERKFDVLKEKIDREDKFTKTWKRRATLFLHSGQKADEMLTKYREDLKSRFKSGRLHAADLSVLFAEDDSQAIDEVLNQTIERDENQAPIQGDSDPIIEDDLKDFLLEARDNIGAVLETLVDKVQFEPNPQSLSIEDRFGVWNRQLDEALSTASILGALKEEGDDEESFYASLIDRSLHKKEVTMKDLVDAAVHHHRASIFETIRGRLPNIDTADEELFIGQYGRFHQDLKDSKTFQELKERRSKLEARQTQYYSDSQEAQRKIYEVFPNGEWNRVWTAAEPIVDQIQWESLQSQVLEEDEDFEAVGKEEVIRRAFIQFGTKHRWSVNPSSIDAFWKPLIKSGTPDEFYKNLRETSSLVLNDTLARDEISQAVTYNYERLAGGEHTDLPGENLLNEIEIQVMPYRMDIARQCQEYSHHFAHLQESFDHNPQALGSTLSLLHEIQHQLCPYLESQKQEMANMLQQLAPDKTRFTDEYTRSIQVQIDALSTSAKAHWEGLQNESLHENRGYKFGKDDELFQHFPGLFSQLDQSFSFVDSDRGREILDQHFKAHQESQQKVPQVANFLKDELGLFEPGGREKAQERYETMQQDYSHTFSLFQENFRTYEKRMHMDIKNKGISDEQFVQRHGESRAQVIDNIGLLRKSQGDFTQFWEKYKEEGFFNRWLQDYENPQTRSGALSEFEFWDTVEGQKDTMAGLNQVFGTWINAHNESWLKEDHRGENMWETVKAKVLQQGKNEMLPHFLLKTTQWYSFNGIMGMLTEAYDLVGRISERRVEKEKYELGRAIFGEDGPWGLGHEFTRKSTETEEARVDEYKNRYKRWKIWDIKKELYDVRGEGEKDKARALIDLLVEKGQIRWNDPQFWYVLNRLNEFNTGAPQFTPADIEKDQGEIRDKARTACEAIWDDYVFAAWEGSLPGNYKNAVESSYDKFDNMESYGNREDIWAETLDKWKRGVPDETVDPAEYEGFLKRAFENGKENGIPDRRWFYLIMGMTVKNPQGETLLSRETLDRFDGELLSTIPYFDFFTDKTSPKKDGKIVPEGTPGTHDQWTFEDIQDWGRFFGAGQFGFEAKKSDEIKAKCTDFFYNYICSSPNALMRVDRMNRGAKSNADHDDAQMWFAGMSLQGMAQSLNRASEGTDLVTPDFAANFVDGFDLYMKSAYEYIARGDSEYGVDHPGWQKMRKLRLQQVGQRMRVGFAALHTISGNYEANGAQTPLTVDQSFWEESEKGKYNLNINKNKINDTVKDLLQENGKNIDDYGEIWNKRGTKEVSENSSVRRKDPKWISVNKQFESIIGSDDKDLGGSHFEEVGSIEKVLKRYVDNHGGLYNDSRNANAKPKFLYQVERQWESGASTNSLGIAV